VFQRDANAVALVTACLALLQGGAIPGLQSFPVPIMRWTEQFYLDVFSTHGQFQLREHGESSLYQSVATVCCHPPHDGF
jgi:hypothetical protein